MEKSCVSGVYAFWCELEGRCYVGGSLDLEGRRKRHIYRLRAGKHNNKRLQRAFDKHGEAALDYVVLEECSANLVAAVEARWVRELAGALFDPPSAALTSGTPGVASSRETRTKISASLSGQVKSLEHRRRLWDNRVGWKHSQEAKARISESLRKAAEAGTRLGPPVGYKHSDEAKVKMSRAGKGRPKSPEHRAKIAAAVRAARRRRKWSSKKS